MSIKNNSYKLQKYLGKYKATSEERYLDKVMYYLTGGVEEVEVSCSKIDKNPDSKLIECNRNPKICKWDPSEKKCFRHCNLIIKPKTLNIFRKNKWTEECIQNNCIVNNNTCEPNCVDINNIFPNDIETKCKSPCKYFSQRNNNNNTIKEICTNPTTDITNINWDQINPTSQSTLPQPTSPLTLFPNPLYETLSPNPLYEPLFPNPYAPYAPCSKINKQNQCVNKECSWISNKCVNKPEFLSSFIDYSNLEKNRIYYYKGRKHNRINTLVKYIGIETYNDKMNYKFEILQDEGVKPNEVQYIFISIDSKNRLLYLTNCLDQNQPFLKNNQSCKAPACKIEKHLDENICINNI